MTTVRCVVYVPGPSGDIPADGSLDWVPTTGRIGSTQTLGTASIVPQPFTVRLNGSAGTITSVTVDPTDSTWCWKVTERITGGGTRYVQVPSSGTVDYGALVDVDPATLSPTTTPVAAFTAALTAAIAAQAVTDSAKPVPADSLHVWGHSYMEGSGPGITVGVNDITTVTAEILGLPMRNDAIGGASLYNPVWGNGSWADILQKVTRPARFSTPTGVNLTMFGINDLNHLGNTAGALAPFFMAYRACISRWRQGRIFENDDATVTLAGGVFWNLVPQTNSNSGANISYTSAPIDGATVTIAVPGDFPGGTLVLGFLSWTDGGATISGTVNGTVYSINTATAYRTDTVIPNVLRIPNVPAGSGTYVFTVQSHTSAVGAVFDYWAWEPAEADCPLVVLVKQPYPLDYTAYGSVAPGPPTNAGVDALNAGLDALAAEFGARVITVDTSSISSDATCWSAANIHPNAKGSRIIAEKIAAAVRGNITASQTLQYQAKRVEYGTAAPTGTMTKWRVGDQVVNTAPTELGSAASKYVITGWICTVAGAPGTWLQQRTLTGN